MLKCIPACAAACLVCLPAAVDARSITFRQYGEVTTCALSGSELLVNVGAPVWLSGGEYRHPNGAWLDLPVEGGSAFATWSSPLIEQLSPAALGERCRLVARAENDRELAATLEAECAEFDSAAKDDRLTELGEPIMSTLMLVDSPAAGGRSRSSGDADLASDPGLMIRLAIVLAVGCFPPLLHNYTQRPHAAGSTRRG